MKDKFSDFREYVDWRGDLTFEQSPYNTVDGLIFCQISYIYFNGLLDNSFVPKHTMASLYDVFRNSPDFDVRKNMGAVINHDTVGLFYKASQSKRFKDVKICGFEYILDEEKEEQFAALTFIIDKEHFVVTYRGTDDTIVGWKEDCNLVYMNVIPSQLDAVKYLNNAGESLKGDITVIGHSKGGNLAVYGGVYCDKKLHKRIRGIYNYDGPGFDKAFFETDEFKAMEEKLVSLYPYFDVVGMFFNHSGKLEIIDSNNVAVLQHDPFSWNVMGNDFVKKDSFDKDSKYVNDCMNDFIYTLPIDERCRCINLLFDIIKASGVKTNYEIEQNKLQCSAKMFSAFASLSSEDKNMLGKFVQTFIKVGRKNIPIFNIFNIKSNLQEEIAKLGIPNIFEDTMAKVNKKSSKSVDKVKKGKTSLTAGKS
ncbi:MAG: DUF2974 domain-containing protein [Treponema sp.]|nr:DUF2974 domain-containing protein [Treponema sp.]